MRVRRPRDLLDRIAGQSQRQNKDAAQFLGRGIPSGTVVLTGSPAAPKGFLLCNGAAVSRTTYAALFAAIGTAFGVGDGSTTFNLPNQAALGGMNYMIKT